MFYSLIDFFFPHSSFCWHVLFFNKARKPLSTATQVQHTSAKPLSPSPGYLQPHLRDNQRIGFRPEDLPSYRGSIKGCGSNKSLPNTLYSKHSHCSFPFFFSSCSSSPMLTGVPAGPPAQGKRRNSPARGQSLPCRRARANPQRGSLSPGSRVTQRRCQPPGQPPCPQGCAAAESAAPQQQCNRASVSVPEGSEHSPASRISGATM